MIKILHAADLHLDSPFQALGAQKAALRRTEQRGLLESIAALAKGRGADLLLLAGDLFDSDAAFSETGRTLERVFAGIDIPVFIAPGNHDWFSARSPWARLALGERVHIFRAEDMECVELPALGARVWGSAFTGRSRSAPLRGFEAEKDGGIVDIMCIHGEVGVQRSSYAPIAEEELARSGMDYVALGHVHSFSGLRKAGDTYYAWPGCPEGRGFDECGEKGVLWLELSAGECRAEFLPLGGRRYEVLEVDMTDESEPLAAIEKVLPPDTERDIYRLILRGETDYPPDRRALLRALEGRFFALELRDESRLRQELWASCGEDSLRGLFLTKLRAKYEAASDKQTKDLVAQAAHWGLRAMEQGEEPPLL